MNEYRVLVLGADEYEETLNQLIKDGWSLVDRLENRTDGNGYVVTIGRTTFE